MKIGIITFWNSKDNYGQLLQCYALQAYLKKLGHTPFLIRYQNNPTVEPNFKFSKIFVYLRNFPSYIRWFIDEKTARRNRVKYAVKDNENDRQFAKFIDDHISYTEHVYTEEDINRNPPLADAYICGSDQIWGGEWAYYLNFAPPGTPRIAYAPSLGGLMSFSPEYEEQLKSLLQQFDFIGMREKTGVEVCHRLGRKDAVQVVDPTMLLFQDDYNKIRPNSSVSKRKPYVLVYLLGNPMECEVSEIFDFAESKGLEVIYVPSSGRFDDYQHEYPTIPEWIDLIAQSEMVITNSFHGTVFSLIYERPFVTILLKGGYKRMNSRVVELLHEAGLCTQIYGGDFNQIPLNVDFSQFRDNRSAKEDLSHDYLESYLKE